MLFAALSVSANDSQPLARDLPCETLLQGEIWHWFRPRKIHHTARLDHSVAFSCTYTALASHTHTDSCMPHTQNWLMVLFGAVATTHWLTHALHLRETKESMLLFLHRLSHLTGSRVPPNTHFIYCMVPHECWWWREWLYRWMTQSYSSCGLGV